MDLSPDSKPVPESEKPIQAKFATGTGSGPPDPLPDDPWKNRSRLMRCNSCMFFVFKRPDELGGMLTNGFLGRCRRHAPTMSGYPAVFELDWCGDHKVDENKI